MNTPPPAPAMQCDAEGGAPHSPATVDAPAPPRPPIHLRFDAWFKSLTDEERLAYGRARVKTEADMRRDMGIDPTLPGFVGMLNSRSREAFDKRHVLPAHAPAAPKAASIQPPRPQDTLFD